MLDKATANIDTETESLSAQTLSVLMKERTTIMAAHRLSTIQHANKSIVLHHGQIRESGICCPRTDCTRNCMTCSYIFYFDRYICHVTCCAVTAFGI